MELWNDFEGKTVAGRFPLERLLGPQGRSAFFSTTANGSGPAVIRLIETHFDEEEILGRWRVVMGLGEPSLQALRVCGATELDGTKLVYAVLEPTDMELGDALRERPLTVAETRQVATSVLAALGTLHAAGLVHEHVEAGYVLAQGEAVKLRSDCVREAPEGAAGDAARAADVRGAALLMAKCLVQTTDEGRWRELPAPFGEMVRRGATGEWGVREMEGALADSVLGPVLTRPAAAGQGRVPVGGGAAAVRPVVAGAVVAPVVVAAASVVAAPVAAADRPESVAVVEEPRSGAGGGRLGAEEGRVHGALHASAATERIVMEPVENEGRRTGVWAGGAAVAAVVLGWGAWHVTHRAPAAAPGVVHTAPATTGTGASGAGVQSDAAARGEDRAPAVRPAPAAASAAVPAGRGSWRVIAFTYNREDQARHKAEDLARRHTGLRAEVWSPSGRAPYLVALGGWMDQREAQGMVSRARRDGLPRDTFARNYRR